MNSHSTPLLKILNDSAAYLQERGVESPRLQAELILSHALHTTRLNLYLDFERPLSETELARIRPFLKRRGQREPLQHILGETEFYGLKFTCSPSALIPRPETERLVEQVIERLKPLPPGNLYDVGTGSGVIAITLAHELPGWSVTGFDISEDALELARQNHARYTNLNIQWQQNPLLEGISKPASAVVANLPYLTTEEINALPAEVQHDPTLALNGGDAGLDLIQQLIPQAVQLSLRLYMEVNATHATQAAQLANEAGFSSVKILKDLTGRERFVFAEGV